jgi:hypothetical protein
MQITQAELKSLIDYDPLTGVFMRKRKTSNSCNKDMSFGHLRKDGYIIARIRGKLFLLSRLAWFHTHGIWPDQIDHINGIRADNRIENLRCVSNAQNHQNRLGVGAYLDKRTMKWYSQIKVNYKTIYIGKFTTKEEAMIAYTNMKKIIHPFSERQK